MTKKRKRPFRSTSLKLAGRKIKAKAIKGDLQLDGKLDLLAAAGDNKDSEPKLTLFANTGKPMRLTGYEHPVIVDMKGATFDKSVTPIIADHKTSNRIGHTTEQIVLAAGQRGQLGGKEVAGPFIGAVGVRSSDMEEAKNIIKDAKSGFPFQVSIGATIRKGYELGEGEEADINGKTWTGPLIVAQKTAIRELTVTVLGADNDTTTIVAANKKENDMEFEAWVESLGLELSEQSEATVTALKATHADLYPTPEKGKKGKKKIKAKIKAGSGPDDDDEGDDDDDAPNHRKRSFVAGADVDTLDDINAQLADNRTRVNMINATADEFAGQIEDEIVIKAGRKEIKMNLDEYTAYAIKKNVPAHEFELTCRRLARPTATTPAIHMVDKSFDAKALEISILRANGIRDTAENKVTERGYGLEEWYDEKALTASWDKKYQVNNSINKLLALQCRAAGKHTSHLTDEQGLMAAACDSWNSLGGRSLHASSGASALSITNILENVMHKAALAAFESVEGVWRLLAGTMDAKDFRTHNMYRLDMNGHFRKVPTNGELKHVGISDTKYTVSVDTYGAMIAVDRKTQIDDDLGMVVNKARGIGLLGGQRVEELFFVTLLGNSGSFFASGNNNLISGAGTALSISSLETAETNFANLVINDKPIGVSPVRLLVGTNQKVNATRLYTRENMEATTTANTPIFANNPYVGRFAPVVSGYLNNTSIKDQDGNAITGQSSTQWYLFPQPNLPQGSAVVMAFLRGRQSPFFDEAETQFNIPGGIQMRAYFDFGAAFNVKQLALKSAGA